MLNAHTGAEESQILMLSPVHEHRHHSTAFLGFVATLTVQGDVQSNAQAYGEVDLTVRILVIDSHAPRLKLRYVYVNGI